MPEIKNMKYNIGLGEETIAQISIPANIYKELTQDELMMWINKIAVTCPLYEGREKEVGNHAQATLTEPDYVEEPAF